MKRTKSAPSSLDPVPVKPELISPAGSLEKLKTAFLYGADAAYIGARKFSLRQHAENFSFKQIREARRLAEKLGKKIYLALNIYFYDTDFAELRKTLKTVKDTGVDTLIISDPGVLRVLNEEYPHFHIHLSTQANATNSESVKFYAENRVERIILARELTLENIRRIRKAVPNIELESFVHGAMCLSYSGRCLLSHYFTGRSANRGDCCQSCRWEYTLTEKKRDNEELEIISNERGTTVLSSMDMNLVDQIPELADVGINAFKIEGRMKSEYYTAVTARTYRLAIDAWREGRKLASTIKNELDTFSHRPYFTGFYFKPPHETQRSVVPKEHYVRNRDFLGLVGSRHKNGLIKIEIKNTIRISEKIEVFPPGLQDNPFIPMDLKLYKKENGKTEETDVLHITDKGFMTSKQNLRPGSIIRSGI